MFNKLKNLNLGKTEKAILLGTALVFSLQAFVFVCIGIRAQSWNLRYGLLITDFFLLALPWLYVWLQKKSFGEYFRFKNVSWKSYLLVFLLTLSVLPLIGGINSVALFILQEIFGKAEVLDLSLSNDWQWFLLDVFFVAVSAGIFEEIFFRGFLLRSFEKFGAWPAIIFTAVLFGLMHLDVFRFVGTALAGIYLGVIVYRSGSIFLGMFGHFLVNAFSMLLYLFSQESSKSGDVFGVESSTLDFPALNTEFFVSLLVLFLFFGSIFAWFFKKFWKQFDQSFSPSHISLQKVLYVFLGLLPGLLLIALIYFMDIARIMEWKIEYLDWVKSLLVS